MHKILEKITFLVTLKKMNRKEEEGKEKPHPGSFRNRLGICYFIKNNTGRILDIEVYPEWNVESACCLHPGENRMIKTWKHWCKCRKSKFRVDDVGLSVYQYLHDGKGKLLCDFIPKNNSETFFNCFEIFENSSVVGVKGNYKEGK